MKTLKRRLSTGDVRKEDEKKTPAEKKQEFDGMRSRAKSMDSVGKHRWSIKSPKLRKKKKGIFEISDAELVFSTYVGTQESLNTLQRKQKDQLKDILEKRDDESDLQNCEWDDKENTLPNMKNTRNQEVIEDNMSKPIQQHNVNTEDMSALAELLLNIEDGNNLARENTITLKFPSPPSSNSSPKIKTPTTTPQGIQTPNEIPQWQQDAMGQNVASDVRLNVVINGGNRKSGVSDKELFKKLEAVQNESLNQDSCNHDEAAKITETEEATIQVVADVHMQYSVGMEGDEGGNNGVKGHEGTINEMAGDEAATKVEMLSTASFEKDKENIFSISQPETSVASTNRNSLANVANSNSFENIIINKKHRLAPVDLSIVDVQGLNPEMKFSDEVLGSEKLVRLGRKDVEENDSNATTTQDIFLSASQNRFLQNDNKKIDIIFDQNVDNIIQVKNSKNIKGQRDSQTNIVIHENFSECIAECVNNAPEARLNLLEENDVDLPTQINSLQHNYNNIIQKTKEIDDNNNIGDMNFDIKMVNDNNCANDDAPTAIRDGQTVLDCDVKKRKFDDVILAKQFGNNKITEDHLLERGVQKAYVNESGDNEDDFENISTPVKKERKDSILLEMDNFTSKHMAPEAMASELKQYIVKVENKKAIKDVRIENSKTISLTIKSSNTESSENDNTEDDYIFESPVLKIVPAEAKRTCLTVSPSPYNEILRPCYTLDVINTDKSPASQKNNDTSKEGLCSADIKTGNNPDEDEEYDIIQKSIQHDDVDVNLNKINDGVILPEKISATQSHQIESWRIIKDCETTETSKDMNQQYQVTTKTAENNFPKSKVSSRDVESSQSPRIIVLMKTVQEDLHAEDQVVLVESVPEIEYGHCLLQYEAEVPVEDRKLNPGVEDSTSYSSLVILDVEEDLIEDKAFTDIAQKIKNNPTVEEKIVVEDKIILKNPPRIPVGENMTRQITIKENLRGDCEGFSLQIENGESDEEKIDETEGDSNKCQQDFKIYVHTNEVEPIETSINSNMTSVHDSEKLGNFFSQMVEEQSHSIDEEETTEIFYKDKMVTKKEVIENIISQTEDVNEAVNDFIEPLHENSSNKLHNPSLMRVKSGVKAPREKKRISVTVLLEQLDQMSQHSDEGLARLTLYAISLSSDIIQEAFLAIQHGRFMSEIQSVVATTVEQNMKEKNSPEIVKIIKQEVAKEPEVSEGRIESRDEILFETEPSVDIGSGIEVKDTTTELISTNVYKTSYAKDKVLTSAHLINRRDDMRYDNLIAEDDKIDDEKVIEHEESINHASNQDYSSACHEINKTIDKEISKRDELIRKLILKIAKAKSYPSFKEKKDLTEKELRKSHRDEGINKEETSKKPCQDESVNEKEQEEEQEEEEEEEEEKEEEEKEEGEEDDEKYANPQSRRISEIAFVIMKQYRSMEVVSEDENTIEQDDQEEESSKFTQAKQIGLRDTRKEGEMLENTNEKSLKKQQQLPHQRQHETPDTEAPGREDTICCKPYPRPMKLQIAKVETRPIPAPRIKFIPRSPLEKPVPKPRRSLQKYNKIIGDCSLTHIIDDEEVHQVALPVVKSEFHFDWMLDETEELPLIMDEKPLTNTKGLKKLLKNQNVVIQNGVMTILDDTKSDDITTSDFKNKESNTYTSNKDIVPENIKTIKSNFDISISDELDTGNTKDHHSSEVVSNEQAELIADNDIPGKAVLNDQSSVSKIIDINFELSSLEKGNLTSTVAQDAHSCKRDSENKNFIGEDTKPKLIKRPRLSVESNPDDLSEKIRRSIHEESNVQRISLVEVEDGEIPLWMETKDEKESMSRLKEAHFVKNLEKTSDCSQQSQTQFLEEIVNTSSVKFDLSADDMINIATLSERASRNLTELKATRRDNWQCTNKEADKIIQLKTLDEKADNRTASNITDDTQTAETTLSNDDYADQLKMFTYINAQIEKVESTHEEYSSPIGFGSQAEAVIENKNNKRDNTKENDVYSSSKYVKSRIVKGKIQKSEDNVVCQDIKLQEENTEKPDSPNHEAETEVGLGIREKTEDIRRNDAKYNKISSVDHVKENDSYAAIDVGCLRKDMESTDFVEENPLEQTLSSVVDIRSEIQQSNCKAGDGDKKPKSYLFIISDKIHKTNISTSSRVKEDYNSPAERTKSPSTGSNSPVMRVYSQTSLDTPSRVLSPVSISIPVDKVNSDESGKCTLNVASKPSAVLVTALGSTRRRTNVFVRKESLPEVTSDSEESIVTPHTTHADESLPADNLKMVNLSLSQDGDLGSANLLTLSSSFDQPTSVSSMTRIASPQLIQPLQTTTDFSKSLQEKEYEKKSGSVILEIKGDQLVEKGDAQRYEDQTVTRTIPIKLSSIQLKKPQMITFELRSAGVIPNNKM